MKVLYFTARVPYPPHRGDQLIAYEQIKRIDKSKIDLYLVCFISKNEDKVILEEKLGNHCKKIFYLKNNKFLSLLAIAKSFYNKRPMQVNFFSHRVNDKKINSIVNEVLPDVIHVQTVRLAQLLKNYKVPKVLDMIDVLSLNMRRRASKEKLVMKFALRFEAQLLENYETDIIDDFNVISLVSKNDFEEAKLNDKSKIIINPNGTSMIDSGVEDKFGCDNEDILLFHGNMSYFPNVQAMHKFVEEVWPIIHNKYPHYQLYIVGREPVGKIQKLHGKNNVVVTGEVDDMTEYLKKARIGIYPLNSGTGMQNKIVEALACGLPSIASNYAIQGISNITNEEVKIANTKEEYIDSVIELVENVSLRERYRVNGQEFIYKNYSWNKNLSTLQQMWESAISQNEYKVD